MRILDSAVVTAGLRKGGPERIITWKLCVGRGGRKGKRKLAGGTSPTTLAWSRAERGKKEGESR